MRPFEMAPPEKFADFIPSAERALLNIFTMDEKAIMENILAFEDPSDREVAAARLFVELQEARARLSESLEELGPHPSSEERRGESTYFYGPKKNYYVVRGDGLIAVCQQNDGRPMVGTIEDAFKAHLVVVNGLSHRVVSA